MRLCTIKKTVAATASSINEYIIKFKRNQQIQEKSAKTTRSDRLEKMERIFLELVDTNNGRVTALKFAIASKLSLEESKRYLDKKALTLNATFEVTEEGSVSYCFYFRLKMPKKNFLITA